MTDIPKGTGVMIKGSSEPLRYYMAHGSFYEDEEVSKPRSEERDEDGMNDKKVELNNCKLGVVKKTEHFHTAGQPYIRLGEDDYLYIEERCIECGKILGGRRIKTEPLLEEKE